MHTFFAIILPANPIFLRGFENLPFRADLYRIIP
jgi:hypothetical protein